MIDVEVGTIESDNILNSIGFNTTDVSKAFQEGFYDVMHEGNWKLSSWFDDTLTIFPNIHFLNFVFEFKNSKYSPEWIAFYESFNLSFS